DRLWLADDQAEQPATLRQVADAVTLGLRHPRRDELAQGLPIGAEDAERRVPGPDDLPCGVHDLLQHTLEGVLREDRHPRRQQGFEATTHPHPFTGALPGTAGLGGWFSPHTERLRSDHANPQVQADPSLARVSRARSDKMRRPASEARSR